MHEMEELKQMLCDELEKITRKGELSAGSLDAVDKLTHSIKSIDTIIAMEESGYSNEYANEYSGRNMSRGRDGRYSYARGRRGGRRGYSRDDSMMSMKYQLQDMLEDANTEEERRMIQKWMKQVED